MNEDKKQPDNKLFFAEITETGPAHSTVAVSFAGKKLEHICIGKNHIEEAANYVAEWNAHFDTEWKIMCEMMTYMSCMFVKMLRLNGVSESTITAALRGVEVYGLG